ncbi:GIY-YIG nuclease family protein [Cupriavidus pauculus]|uniref:GIY-YIG nuclease family protein n=1 Tax=Cupriavidus pauculus TaxID=82633 RepID=UPI001EE20C18|nr:GIY-YIG nuclease family protein [Cupriavidus pauculus]GJG96840.1 hypothetical protein CBA19C6_20145 [Cupriavidus pauculus]
MTQLTTEQLSFLRAQRISLSWVFDASGLSAAERKSVMSALSKKFYYGGASCKAAGHSLRTKSGHCIQCDTSKIAYELRSSASGHVYLAHSPSTGLIKIGYTQQHPQDRGQFLRNEAYGGIQDWDIKRLAVLDKDAGKKEFEIHQRLDRFQKPILYKKGAVVVECREIFSCDLSSAIIIFDEIVAKKS